MLRLSIVISHPIQYHAPLYSYLAADGRFDLSVIYMTDRGARAYFDKFAGRLVQFDNPILTGYSYTFLRRGEPKTLWEKKAEFVNFRLGKEVARSAPQAVYFHGYDNPSFWPAMAWCRRHGVKVLFRGENEDELDRPPLRRFLRERFLELLIPRIDAFLYIGKANHEFFLRRGVPESKLFHVPYSVDNGYFRDGVTGEEVGMIRRKVRDLHHLPGHSRLFIYTHKLRDTMRPLDAVKAWCLAASSFSRPATLIMCGDGDLRAESEAIARSCPTASIVFTGYLSQADLREHLLAADVMINPAIEPWGCSVNEGIASALAVISSDKVVGWPDMSRPGENGAVYRCGDLEALAALIRDFAACPVDQIERMKQRSLELARTDLSFQTCADGIAAAMTA